MSWTFGEPIPQEILDRHQIALFPACAVAVKPKTNPLIRAFGEGPKGLTCKGCKHLYRKHLGRTYIKCHLRPPTNGAGTDHKASWPSCGKYESAV
ncbi:hypothetical protein BH09VER1_BH09VER1_28830 [soil metagenome]